MNKLAHFAAGCFFGTGIALRNKFIPFNVLLVFYKLQMLLLEHNRLANAVGFNFEPGTKIKSFKCLEGLK